MPKVKHDCPEDPAAFFAQLEAIFTFGLQHAEPPEGYATCVICGGFYKVDDATE